MKHACITFIAVSTMLAAHAAANPIPIDQVVLNDDLNVDHVSNDPTDFLIDDDVTLTSFDAGGKTYTDLQLVNAVSAAGGSQFEGQNATSGGTSAQSVTDDRIDTGTTDVGGSIFRFVTAPTLLSDVVFVFELTFNGNPDQAIIQLVDDTDAALGSTVTLSNAFWNDGLADFDPTVNGSNFTLGGIAVPLSEFGITSGQLPLVDGLEIVDDATGLDPVLIGIAADPIPEPTSAACLAVLGLFLTRRTRRRLS